MPTQYFHDALDDLAEQADFGGTDNSPQKTDLFHTQGPLAAVTIIQNKEKIVPAFS